MTRAMGTEPTSTTKMLMDSPISLSSPTKKSRRDFAPTRLCCLIPGSSKTRASTKTQKSKGIHTTEAEAQAEIAFDDTAGTAELSEDESAELKLLPPILAVADKETTKKGSSSRRRTTEAERVAQQWVEACNTGDISQIMKLTSAGSNVQFPASGKTISMRKYLKTIIGDLQDSFPNLHFDYDSLEETDDCVVTLTNFFAIGTHTGAPFQFSNEEAIPATGTKVFNGPMVQRIRVCNQKVVDIECVVPLNVLFGPPGFYFATRAAHEGKVVNGGSRRASLKNYVPSSEPSFLHDCSGRAAFEDMLYLASTSGEPPMADQEEKNKMKMFGRIGWVSVISFRSAYSLKE